jgi:hypothetical protein
MPRPRKTKGIEPTGPTTPRSDDFVVRRLTFDDRCQLAEESTFQTEAELNGVTLKQLILPICNGERPIEGPLFQQPQKGDPQ